MKTLIISKQEVNELLPLNELINKLREAYILDFANKIVKPQKISSQISKTSMVASMPGYLPNFSTFTVKVNVKVPNNISLGLPFLSGVILLFDIQTGQLLSIMDSSLITAMRTGAAGAIGVDCLANVHANKIAVIGAGLQAEWQIKALHAIGRVNEVFIYDVVKEQSIKFANKLKSWNISHTITSSIKSGLKSCNIAITTTQSKSPIITTDMLSKGLHINAFGADQPGKAEIDADVFNQSLIALDDKELAFSCGPLNVANQQQLLSSKNSYIEIGEILQNKSKGRSSHEQITVFGNVGLAFQDLVACSIIYKNALRLKKGSWINLDGSLDYPSITSNPTSEEKKSIRRAKR
jgi:ornithine cyclodeaminase